MTDSSFDTHASALRARCATLNAAQPGLRARAQADALGVAEVQWLAAGCEGVQATALGGPPQAIFREVGGLGEVMALTRNAWCVHERHGRYQDIRAEGPMGIVLGPDIDLRVFFSQWQSAWAVVQDGRHSVQFFDRTGTAVHKIYRTPATDAAAWDALVARFAAPAHWPEVTPAPDAPQAGPVPDPASLRTDWLAMQDTHEFFGLLRRHQATRVAALQAVGPDLAQPVPPDSAERVLVAAATQGLPIMVFVGNRGLIQIHTGPVHALRRTGPWFNVLDARFNLHLDTSAIAATWVVNKPTSDGWVTSLEVYAGNGELIVQMFGERKPGKPELSAWRALLSGLCSQALAT